MTSLELFNLQENFQRKDNWYNRAAFLYHRVFFSELFFFHVWELDSERFRFWDRLLERQPLTGISGSGAYQNEEVPFQTTWQERLFSIRVNSYLESFRSVSTHMLLPKREVVSEKGKGPRCLSPGSLSIGPSSPVRGETVDSQ